MKTFEELFGVYIKKDIDKSILEATIQSLGVDKFRKSLTINLVSKSEIPIEQIHDIEEILKSSELNLESIKINLETQKEENNLEIKDLILNTVNGHSMLQRILKNIEVKVLESENLVQITLLNGGKLLLTQKGIDKKLSQIISEKLGKPFNITFLETENKKPKNILNYENPKPEPPKEIKKEKKRRNKNNKPKNWNKRRR